MPVDIEKLEALTKAATPLPWQTEDSYERNTHYERKTLLLVADGWIRATLQNQYSDEKADAEYVVAAIHALPELIEENKELQKRVQELESQVQFMKGKHDTALDLYTTYHNDNVKLRNELHDIAAQRDVLATHLSCCAYFNVEAHTPSEWIELAKEAVKKEDSK